MQMSNTIVPSLWPLEQSVTFPTNAGVLVPSSSPSAGEQVSEHRSCSSPPQRLWCLPNSRWTFESSVHSAHLLPALQTSSCAAVWRCSFVLCSKAFCLASPSWMTLHRGPPPPPYILSSSPTVTFYVPSTSCLPWSPH